MVRGGDAFVSLVERHAVLAEVAAAFAGCHPKRI
jgi:hypothetical protein